MAAKGRINPFWLGAGSLLVVFAGNEIVAYRLARVPRWLGGPMAFGGAIVALLVGLFIVWAYGFEEPVEKDRNPEEATAPSLPELEPDGEASSQRDPKDDEGEG